MSTIIAVAGRKQSGKCVTGDTIVFSKYGLKRISSLVPKVSGFSNISRFSVLGEQGEGFVDNVYFENNCEVYDIETDYGYSISGTKDHPIRVLSKDNSICWKKINDISIGDYIVISNSDIDYSGDTKIGFCFNREAYIKQKPKYLSGLLSLNLSDVKIPSNFTKSIARFCGFFIAEGNSYKNNIVVTNNDKEMLLDIKKMAFDSFGILAIIHYRRCNNIQINRVQFFEFCKHIGLLGKSGDKRISDKLLGLPKEMMSELLKAYFEGDGGVEKKCISCTSKSYNLIKDIQTILLTFGIVSSIVSTMKFASNTKDKIRRKYYRLTIYGENILKFKEKIGFFSNRKNKQLKILCNKIKDISRNEKIGSIPFLKQNISDFIKKLPIRKNGAFVVNGKKVAQIKQPEVIRSYTNGGINRKSLVSCCDYLEKTALLLDNSDSSIKCEAKHLISSITDTLNKSLFFVRVKKKIKVSNKDVFDICKSGKDHSFISNGIISHNSSLCNFLSTKLECETDDVVKHNVTQDENGVVWDNVSQKHDGFQLSKYKGIPGNNIYSFADPLKRFCIDVMGLKEEQCYGTDEQKNTETEYLWDNIEISIRYRYGEKTNDGAIPRSGRMTGREVMQVWGSDIMRNMFSDTIWVNAAMKMIDRDNFPISFISDLRFKSEAEALLDRGNSYIIYLGRKVFEDTHISEKDLDDYDFVSNFGNRCLVVDNQNMVIKEKNAAVVPFFDSILGRK